MAQQQKERDSSTTRKYFQRKSLKQKLIQLYRDSQIEMKDEATASYVEVYTKYHFGTNNEGGGDSCTEPRNIYTLNYQRRKELMKWK